MHKDDVPRESWIVAVRSMSAMMGSTPCRAFRDQREDGPIVVRE